LRIGIRVGENQARNRVWIRKEKYLPGNPF